MKISPARLAAFRVLERIETRSSFSSVLLPAAEADLSPKDRGLCHEIVLGTLRRQIYLDRLIDELSGSKKLDSAVRISLRLGAFQLLYLDKVPAYPAINESVELVGKAKKTSAKGFVNAILRKISKGTPALEYSDEIDRISIETSHPRWLVEKWADDFGTDEAERIAIANNATPPVSFRLTARTPEGFDAGGFRRSDIVDGCYFAEPSDAHRLRQMAENGEIYFQDEASQLVAQVASRAGGSKFLDVCAAPGGKTTQVAAALRREGSTMLVAGDLHAGRVRQLRSTCDLQGVAFANVVQYDAERALPFADESFDTILVDAPCSGTGTIRHNPEIRHFLDPGDLPALVEKQRAILRNASKLVRPGGQIVYSTCSIQIEENEGVCRDFLSRNDGFEAARPNVPDRFLTEDGFARTFPHRDSTDGFFIALLERRGK